MPKSLELNALKRSIQKYVYLIKEYLFYDPDIDVPEGIGAHYVSTGFADPLPFRNSVEIDYKRPLSLITSYATSWCGEQREREWWSR